MHPCNAPRRPAAPWCVLVLTWCLAPGGETPAAFDGRCRAPRSGPHATITCCGTASVSAARQVTPAPDPAAARIHPYVERPRVLVMTDIANEPDDQMSLVRFLVYANRYDVEGLVATTSTWMRNKVRPDVIHAVLDAYDQVQPNLLVHEPGFPSAGELRRVVASGQPGFGMAAVGPGRATEGAAEAGTGIPGQPVFAGGLVPIGGGGVAGEGGIPPAHGPREPAARITLEHAATPRVVVTPHVPGTAHVILAVEDDDTPSLTAYRRIILTIAPAKGAP